LPASDWLAASTLAYFVERFGGSREAAVEAMQRPGFAEEIKRLGAYLDTDPADGRLYLRIPYRVIERGRLAVRRGSGRPGSDDGDRTQPRKPKPRHRPLAPIPKATVKALKWQLAQRKAKLRDPEFAQEKIADRLGLERTRIQHAEALERAC
jgi:hypothetical protein